MSYIEDIQNRRNQVRNNIAKGFGYEFVKAQDDELVEIEKAKSGVYADTAQNRKLGRVGQQYGGKKKTESAQKPTAKKSVQDTLKSIRESLHKHAMSGAGVSLHQTGDNTYQDNKYNNTADVMCYTKADVKYLKKTLKEHGMTYDESKLHKIKSWHGTHYYLYDLSEITGKKSFDVLNR